MPTISQVIKFRQARRSRESQSPWGRIGLALAIAASLMMVSAIAFGTWYYISLVKGLPQINNLPNLVEPSRGTLLQPSKLFDRYHQHVILTLENPSAQSRQYLLVSEDGQAGANAFSQHLVDATLSVFDPGFWSEPGYSLSGIAQGTHPTLAQLLASGLLLGDEPASIKRNIQERLLAMQMTAQYGRQKVLEWYLNSARYGEFIYGADAASHAYLGKPATQLTVAEAALLTAMLESPGLDPWASGQVLRDRQVRVIQAMLENGVIGGSDAQEALQENIEIQAPRTPLSLAPDFTNLVLLQLSAEVPIERIYQGGYEITTSLDYGLQKQAECATRTQLDRVQGSSGQATPDEAAACEAASLLPALPTANLKIPSEVLANVVVLDPASGDILAWVGGSAGQPAPALPAAHPAGSVLSPFFYLTAFTQGMGPASLLWDLPAAGSADLPAEILAAYHGPVRLRIAMANDYAGAALQVLGQVGFENFVQTEQKFGIRTSQPGVLVGGSITGMASQPVSLLDTVRAYGVLANQGEMAGQVIKQVNAQTGLPGLSPRTILQVAQTGKGVWPSGSEADARPIVSAQLAYLVTNVLSDEKPRTAGLADASALEIGRPAAVKTSLSSDGQETWTVGYLPQLAVGVWMGASGELNAEMAAGLWHAMMKYAAGSQPVMNFAIPEGISRVQVCDPSGLLVSPICPSQVEEVFLQGSEPVQQDDLYKEYAIDRQTSYLATIFTPTDQVEKKIFLDIPPEARGWAQAAGFPIPPATYDEFSRLPASAPDARFDQPQMSAYISGKVDLYGSAGGDGFSYYRLEVGQGMNPQQWLQIGENVHQPVQDSLLGTWDTTGLNGNYILELMVVRQDFQLERALLHVVIDNHPPKVHILAPHDNALLNMQKGEAIVLQADVRDDQALQRVEFYVDGERVSTLYEPPFLSLWMPSPGKHTVRVRAYDQAGNWSEASASFSVNQ